jgi:hypothetical protein
MAYGIFTVIGTQKVLAAARPSQSEADLVAIALTRGAQANPKNPTPLHWVEKLVTNWPAFKSNWECGICHDLQYGPSIPCPNCGTLRCKTCAEGHHCP